MCFIKPKCKRCATAHAVIYCKSNSAKFCVNCDVHVHSANRLSSRHKRSMLCDKCFSQPASVRCLDDNYLYCENCSPETRICMVLGHKLRRLNSFSGCPSPTDSATMWSSIVEPYVSGFSPFVGSLPLDDPNNDMLRMANMNEIDGLLSSSYPMVAPHNISYTPNLSDQSSFSSVESKGCPDMVLTSQESEEDICKLLKLENAPLNFGVGDDIIGCSLEENIEPDNTVPNCLLIDKNNTSVTASKFTIDKALETTSPGQQDSTSYHSRPFPMSINTTCLPLPPSPVLFGQIHPTMTHTITGESSAAHYQDSGMSPGFIMSEAPWKQAREKALMRFREKRLKLSFGKQIRYASRKARADTRKRVKGRFVKAGDNYDYDPSSSSNNH